MSQTSKVSILPTESIAKLEKMIKDFDQNLKIIDFNIETETYYDAHASARNIKSINNLLADSSMILANVHAIRYEFTAEYQITIYERIKRRFDEFEERRGKVHLMQERLQAHNEVNRINAEETGGTGNKPEYKILQRNEIIDMNLKTDYNEKLLEEVGANLREIDRNVMDTAVSLKGQGDTLKNVTNVVEGTDNNVKKANSTLRSLSWGQRIQLILLNLIAFFLFVAIIALLIIRILNSGSQKNN